MDLYMAVKHPKVSLLTKAKTLFDIFTDFDFGMLGDIHKQQKMDLER
jgi:hypothetical protein